IGEQADRRNRLVTDLLDLGRLKGGALPLEIEVNAVDDLLGAVQQHVSARRDQDRLRISLDDPSTISFGRFDFVHSLRILVNLVDNAFKHTPEGTPIELTGGVDGDSVVFRVSDRGAGRPCTHTARMCLPYYESPGKAADGQSTGLGLWIARRLTEAQNGELTYR